MLVVKGALKVLDDNNLIGLYAVKVADIRIRKLKNRCQVVIKGHTVVFIPSLAYDNTRGWVKRIEGHPRLEVSVWTDKEDFKKFGAVLLRIAGVDKT